jgi:hypothetical protein
MHVCMFVRMCVFLLMPLPPSPWKFQSVYLLELQAQHLCQSVRNIQLCSSKSRKITNFKIWTENTDNAYNWKHVLIHNEISMWFILDYLPNKNGAPAYIAATGNSSMLITIPPQTVTTVVQLCFHCSGSSEEAINKKWLSVHQYSYSLCY